MFVKRTPTAGWSFADPTAELVKVARRGLVGPDRAALVKRAGAQAADWIDRLEPLPDEPLVHMIALGCTEATGPNRNGDGFKAAACRKYHDTFRKYARLYYDHCFPAGTPVVMGDRERRPIEQIDVGDLVATEAGPREVLRVMRNPYRGRGVSLRLSGLPDPIVATPGHPVLSIKREPLYCRHRYNALHDSPHTRTCPEARFKKENRPQPEYRPIDQLEVGDFVCITPPQAGTKTVPTELARLIGWVASEGYVDRTGRFGFTFSKKNLADIASVTDCLQSFGLKVSRYENKYDCIQLSANCQTLANAVRRYVKGIKSQKRLTDAVLEWSPESKLQMLGAYIDGDGHVGRSGPHAGQLRIRSSSDSMLYALLDVVRSLGVPATLQKDKAPALMTSPTNGREYQADGSGVVNVKAAYSAAVCVCSRKKVEADLHSRSTTSFVDGRFLVRIEEREDVELSEDVYNLEVEDVHHYFANEIVVHNCNTDPSRSYGVIKLAWFNEPMGRIELVIGVNEKKSAAQRNGGLVDTRFLARVEKNAAEASGSMACIPDPEAPILTSEGYRPIRDIKVGDLVYTHEKRWRRVTELKRRSYTGKSVRVRAKGLAVPLWLTADHPMYAAVLSHQPALVGGQRPVQRWSTQSERDGVSGFEWHCAEHLSAGDRLCVAPVVSSADGVGIDSEDLAALLGIYTAEGSLGYNGEVPSTVYLTTHVDDWATREIPALVRRLAPGVTVRLTPKNTSRFGMDIRVFSSELAAWCENLVGRRCENKRVPMQLFSSDENVKLAYIGRWLDGDGFCDVKGVHWSTSNRNLALQLRDLLLSCGIESSIYRIVHKAKRGVVETAEPGVEYTVNVSNFESHRLARYSAKAAANVFAKLPGESPARTKSPCLYKTGGLYSYVISEVETEDLADHTVYNFEVEDDHSYSLYGLASHNCSIPFDVCSSCGNKAASRRYYCTADRCPHGGCRDNLTKVSEDGHLLHVDNPDPKWFDYSDVGTPADRIAYAFGRVGRHTKTAAFGPAPDGGVDPAVDLLPAWTTPGLDAADRRRLILVKLAAREAELLGQPVGPVDAGYARAADAARCGVTPDAWGRRHFGASPTKWARLAGSVKTAFARLVARPDQFDPPPESRYYGTRCPDEGDVIKQAALAALKPVGSHPPLADDALADPLAWHQVAWCAAAPTADETDRRIETVIRVNRAA